VDTVNEARQPPASQTNSPRHAALSITSALAALICFFLPWLQVSCGGERAFTVSGWQLASGAEVMGERQGGHAYIFIVPLLLVALLVLLIVIAWQGRPRATAAVPEFVVGLLCIAIPIIEYLRLRSQAHSEGGEAVLGVTIRYGFWGMMVCGLLLAVGGFRSWAGRSHRAPPPGRDP
jgi:hypothetical protein